MVSNKTSRKEYQGFMEGISALHPFNPQGFMWEEGVEPALSTYVEDWTQVDECQFQ